MLSNLIKITFLTLIIMETNCSELRSLQLKHQSAHLDAGTIYYLAGLSDTSYTNEVLDHILIPRVVGTANHKKVRDYIVSELKSLHWTVDTDPFEDKTPMGTKTFINIIATLNPKAERFLVLACHYDSKYYPDFDFMGATDSAVPCAMILNLAKILHTELKSLKSNDILSLKLLFLDGEEAFEKWGPTDSIYGAKHLSTLWERNRRTSKLTNEVVSDLERIDLFVLLDLIGHKGTRFLSCFEDTQHWFLQMAKIEDKLAELDLLKNNRGRYFEKRKYVGYIEDDHIPFLQKHVPIMHLISIPFPTEWHTENDNRDIIDMKIVEDINKILRIFVVQYLNVLVQPSKHTSHHGK
ncbi:unnamed protein product [Psylliodes chrysocephalus]|uniref:Glutaminyl-peptide cyclotransferase n=1 Tax=Psylliodes chrysocephalus TaxID=3402493 RepID=A0A9P0GDU1_9CUCU|nr:unnamed protein product [Psylliodes chrysocephala]